MEQFERGMRPTPKPSNSFRALAVGTCFNQTDVICLVNSFLSSLLQYDTFKAYNGRIKHSGRTPRLQPLVSHDNQSLEEVVSLEMRYDIRVNYGSKTFLALE